MTSLTARLEAATEGSRELDVEIALEWLHVESSEEAYVRRTNRHDTEARPGDYWLVQRSGRQLKAAPHYTTSLDAALTLVPEGWRVYGMGQGASANYDRWFVELVTVKPHLAPTSTWKRAAALTPALALCIAALKALQAQEPEA